MTIRLRASVIYLVAVGMLLAVMVWTSRRVMELDRERQAAARNAELEERIRLSLWRMDSTLTPLIAVENARPTGDYSTFFSIPPYHLSSISAGDSTDNEGVIQLFFELDRDGKLRSPQVPNAGTATPLARPNTATSKSKLASLQAFLEPAILRQAISESNNRGVWPPLALRDRWTSRGVSEERGLSSNEYVQRLQNISQSAQLSRQSRRSEEALSAQESWMTPVWLGRELLLVRHVVSEGNEYFQGFWVNWTVLERSLLDLIRDLLPDARLIPVLAGDSGASGNMLAALPVELKSGFLSDGSLPGSSALQWSLVVAWLCVFLAATAVGLLLWGTISLSERRGDFVSAVTHELRTPITTFRMYADLLADGMVAEPEKQREYFETLRSEAGRLGHLVENVLSYSRLERKRSPQPLELIRVEAMTVRSIDRLRLQCEAADMQLLVEMDGAARVQKVLADPVAVDQILFNLVDNACKYGKSPNNNRIHLTVGCDRSRVYWRVRDHGPGIPRPQFRRLFRPFTKSAEVAARSAPGIGIGLALSQRLARSMRGSLTIDRQFTTGAAFVLTLPIAR